MRIGDSSTPFSWKHAFERVDRAPSDPHLLVMTGLHDDSDELRPRRDRAEGPADIHWIVKGLDFYDSPPRLSFQLRNTRDLLLCVHSANATRALLRNYEASDRGSVTVQRGFDLTGQ